MSHDLPPMEAPPETFPAANVGSPTSAAPFPARPPRRGRRALVVVSVFILVSAVAGIGVYLAMRPKGPPEAPTALQAQPDLCTPPQCDAFTPSVSLTWSTPTTGDPVTGYTVVRNGTILTTKRLGETSFVDSTVEIGESYAYQVVAHSESGDSPESSEVTTPLPTPSIRLARMDGPYRLTIRVERATNLGRLEGIHNPTRGERRRFVHRLYSACGYGDPACPVSWNLHTRPLRPVGLTYRGSFVDSTRANCFGGSHAPVSIRMSLHVTDAAMVYSAWVVTAFKGTYTISFRCPGSLASVGTLSVVAHS